jgi:dTDP-4-dehydrorhamnose 3,5-epimerase
MTIEATRFSIPGPLLIKPSRFGDARGFFSETYNTETFAAAGIAQTFVQDNHSFSGLSGTVRGLHFQKPPNAQAKLVRVSRGCVLDVVVDIRRDSPSYKQHLAIELSAENWHQLFVPAGFAHGFCTLCPDTEVQYKVTSFYAPDHDAGIKWNDPALSIGWPEFAGAEVSAKDMRLPLLSEIESPFMLGEGANG